MSNNQFVNQLLVELQNEHQNRTEAMKESFSSFLQNIEKAADDILLKNPEENDMTLEELILNDGASTSKLLNATDTIVIYDSHEETFYTAQTASQEPAAEGPPPKRVPTPVSSQRQTKRVCRVQPTLKTTNPIARQMKCPGEQLFSMNGSPLVTGGPAPVADVATLHIDMGDQRTLTLLPGQSIPESIPKDLDFIQKLKRLHASVSDVLDKI